MLSNDVLQIGVASAPTQGWELTSVRGSEDVVGVGTKEEPVTRHVPLLYQTYSIHRIATKSILFLQHRNS